MIYQTLLLPGDQPITITGKTPQFDNLGSVISTLLPYIFTLAGLILFLVIIFAGFTMFTSAGNPDKIKKAGQQLTLGIVGFVIIFASYWIAQLVGSIFGLSLLGS